MMIDLIDDDDGKMYQYKEMKCGLAVCVLEPRTNRTGAALLSDNIDPQFIIAGVNKLLSSTVGLYLYYSLFCFLLALRRWLR